MRRQKLKSPIPLEHDIQAAFIDWVALAQIADERLKLLFAVPNAAKRSVWLAARMKAEGMIAGVPDIMFPLPSSGFNGLAIEFKRPGAKATAAQEDYMALLSRYGWMVVICTDAAAAVRTVKDYLRS